MTAPRSADGAFASCPAATGEATCGHFPDGAHRCGQPREHVKAPDKRAADAAAHTCTCGYVWTSAGGTMDELIKVIGEAR